MMLIVFDRLSRRFHIKIDTNFGVLAEKNTSRVNGHGRGGGLVSVNRVWLASEAVHGFRTKNIRPKGIGSFDSFKVSQKIPVENSIQFGLRTR